jgi:hypothetical protein
MPAGTMTGSFMARQDAPKRGDDKGFPSAERRGRGFAPAGGLVARQISGLAARRGIVVSKLLTRWEEVAGPEIAAITRPMRIAHGKGGFGGTLWLLAPAGRGPELDMLAPAIVERVNAACGHRAVSRVRLTQSAGTGFADGAAPFDPSGAPVAAPRPVQVPPETRARVASAVACIADPALRGALEALGLGIAGTHPDSTTKGPQQ